MAFASAGVPDCWAIANPEAQNSTNVANADANKLLLMAFSLLIVDIFQLVQRRFARTLKACGALTGES
jgi:hypothetical protein